MDAAPTNQPPVLAYEEHLLSTNDTFVLPGRANWKKYIETIVAAIENDLLPLSHPLNQGPIAQNVVVGCYCAQVNRFSYEVSCFPCAIRIEFHLSFHTLKDGRVVMQCQRLTSDQSTDYCKLIYALGTFLELNSFWERPLRPVAVMKPRPVPVVPQPEEGELRPNVLRMLKALYFNQPSGRAPREGWQYLLSLSFKECSTDNLKTFLPNALSCITFPIKDGEEDITQLALCWLVLMLPLMQHEHVNNVRNQKSTISLLASSNAVDSGVQCHIQKCAKYLKAMLEHHA